MNSKDKSAKLSAYIEIFEWLNAEFGETLGPLWSSLERHDYFDETIFKDITDEASRQRIIQGYSNNLCSRMGLCRWPVQVAILDKEQPALSTHKELDIPQHVMSLERYYTDKWGRPVAYFEPSRLEQPGYVSVRLVTFLAQLIIKSTDNFSVVTQYPYSGLICATAAWLGFGQIISAYGSGNDKERDYTGLMLYLRCRGELPEQIRSNFARRMPDLDMVRLKTALSEAEHMDGEITRLRNSMLETRAVLEDEVLTA